jgi:sec-independent protein translocase protein TatB
VFFDISGGELLILVLVALLVLGPERLPRYAAQLGRFVRDARSFALRAREQVRSEMGEEFDSVDWEALDPRRYDPRRIVRDALRDDDDPFAFKEIDRILKDIDLNVAASGTGASLDLATSGADADGPGARTDDDVSADGSAGSPQRPPARPAFDVDAT